MTEAEVREVDTEAEAIEVATEVAREVDTEEEVRDNNTDPPVILSSTPKTRRELKPKPLSE